jgi:hypothetical protein
MSPILQTLANSSAYGYRAFAAAPGEPSFESIATVTVGSGGSSTITFSSIPSTYQHLQLRILARGLNSGNECQFQYTINDDYGSNYAWHLLRGNGSAAFADGYGTQDAMRAQGRYPGDTAISNAFGVGITDFLDYSNTNKNKTARTLGGNDRNGAGQIYYTSSVWLNTSAINKIIIGNSDGTGIAQYSSFALYGIKG